MTKRDLFAQQHQLIENMKALLDNNDLYNLSLNQLEDLHEEIEGTIKQAIDNAKEF